MKTRVLTVIFSILSICSLNKAEAQVFEHEDLVVELNLGFPNLSPFNSSFAQINHSGSFGSLLNSSTRGFGQLVLKGEFFLSDKIGLIGNLNYRYFYDFETREFDIYDGVNETWSTGRYDYELRTHVLRWAFGFNFHLARTDRLDTYFGILGGGSTQNSTLTSNDPNASIYRRIGFPVHVRLQFGLRYMFTNQLGFNTEFGLGGPLISAGITYKINKQ
jgi:hypothetical protein